MKLCDIVRIDRKGRVFKIPLSLGIVIEIISTVQFHQYQRRIRVQFVNMHDSVVLDESRLEVVSEIE